MRNLLERAKRSQAMRLMALGGRRTKEELSTLTEEDFHDSLSELRRAPADEGEEGEEYAGEEGEEGEGPVPQAAPPA